MSAQSGKLTPSMSAGLDPQNFGIEKTFSKII